MAEQVEVAKTDAVAVLKGIYHSVLQRVEYGLHIGTDTYSQCKYNYWNITII